MQHGINAPNNRIIAIPIRPCSVTSQTVPSCSSHCVEIPHTIVVLMNIFRAHRGNADLRCIVHRKHLDIGDGTCVPLVCSKHLLCCEFIVCKILIRFREASFPFVGSFELYDDCFAMFVRDEHHWMVDWRRHFLVRSTSTDGSDRRHTWMSSTPYI